MTYLLHPDLAWVEDEDHIHAMRLPDGELMVLDNVAAVIFADVARGVDPLGQVKERWPDDIEEAMTGVAEFLEQLASMGIIVWAGRHEDD